jgi:putative DNA primase/helicase
VTTDVVARETTTSRWHAFDAAQGKLGPWHVRHDHPDGSKSVTWQLDDGTAGIGDHHLEDLVYGGELLTEQPPALIVVTEGEKAADAVRAAGLPAIGTVCGAASTPGRSVVALLAARPVILWPDHDDVGRRHMERLGRAIETGGVSALAVVRPPVDAPDGWDAADTTAERIRELVESAAGRWIGPVAA